MTRFGFLADNIEQQRAIGMNALTCVRRLDGALSELQDSESKAAVIWARMTLLGIARQLADNATATARLLVATVGACR